MDELTFKHLKAIGKISYEIKENGNVGIKTNDAAKECTKITLEAQIELLKQVTEWWAQGDDKTFDEMLVSGIYSLQQQLSELNKQSNP